MLPKKKTLIPRTRPGSFRFDLKKADSYMLKPRDYEEIPELTDEDFARATIHISGVPVPRGQGMRVRIDQTERQAVSLSKATRKKFATLK
jgi:hypothetical protein